MASEFDKDAEDVERHFTRNWFTLLVSKQLLRYALKHHSDIDFRFARWLMGFANLVAHASPKDGYEWVDRRTSLFSKLAAEQQAELIAGSFGKDGGDD